LLIVFLLAGSKCQFPDEEIPGTSVWRKGWMWSVPPKKSKGEQVANQQQSNEPVVFIGSNPGFHIIKLIR